MRRSSLRAGIAVVLVAALVFTACQGSDKSTPTTDTGLDTRTVEAGEVTVEIDPRRVDERGAEFAVTFDTHTVELDLDVAANAKLTVGGVAWTNPTWAGDGPTGHHRSGVLRFTPAGPADGEIEIRISGLPEAVAARWTLE